MHYLWICLTSGHILQEYIYYERTCIAEVMSCFKIGYVILEDMSNMRTGFTGWYILQEGMPYRRTCVRGGYSHCLSVQHLLET